MIQLVYQQQQHHHVNHSYLQRLHHWPGSRLTSHQCWLLTVSVRWVLSGVSWCEWRSRGRSSVKLRRRDKRQREQQRKHDARQTRYDITVTLRGAVHSVVRVVARRLSVCLSLRLCVKPA